VNVHDYPQVLFYAGANVDPARDVVLARGPLDHLDHAPERQFVGGKLGIDATSKLSEEGARPWPEEIEMSPEIRERVDRRWSEFGIELVPQAGNGAIQQTSRSLRQLLRR
jgi:4-hydroxy-3-polyprenylbenzoate decarboxylase